MKLSDVIAFAIIVALGSFFTLAPGALDAFRNLSAAHGFLMSFAKFAVLATFGECLALRITAGVYNRPGFGVLPRMLVWGMLGILIKVYFTIFIVGTPTLLDKIGFGGFAEAVSLSPMAVHVATAFAISVGVNVVFSPFMMLLHKITDLHINRTGGTLGGFLRPIDFVAILKSIDWDVMWNFVFKKTIPLFWVPAHTITFMLPGEFQILFAAFLGIMLGLILAVAGSRPSRGRLASTLA